MKKLISKLIALTLIFNIGLYTVFAATTFDNFDSYVAGSSLNGQGSWSGDSSPQVITSLSQSSPNSVSLTASNSGDVSKTISVPLTVDGTIFSSYMQSSNANSGAGGSMNLKYYSGATLLFTTRLSQDRNAITFDGASTVDVQTGIANDTWYHVEIEFNFTNKTARARVDGGAWTSSISAVGNANFTQIDKIAIQYGVIVSSITIDTLEYTAPAPASPSTYINRSKVLTIKRGGITTIRK